MLPAVVVKSACQYIAMVALTKSGLDRLVHITWEVRKIEDKKVLFFRRGAVSAVPSLSSAKNWQEQFEASGPAAHIEGLLLLLHLDRSS